MFVIAAFIVSMIFQLLLVFLFPPLLLGIINRTKAFFGGRQGPPLMQPYYDLWRLLHKGTVQSNVTTWIFRAGPVVALATSTLAAMFIPFLQSAYVASFPGDLLLFVYLLALGRFLLVLSSLDTGSPFEGMGAAREVTFACLSEPSLFLGLLALAKVSESLKLVDMLTGAPSTVSWTVAGAPLLLIITSWFLLMLADSCRIPFDDPNTHLELTMIHEVIILDHSGPMLAMLQLSAAQKLFIFAGMIARLAMPRGLSNVFFESVLFLVVVILVTLLVGIVESVVARFKMNVVPRALTAAGIIAAFGLILQETLPITPGDLAMSLSLIDPILVVLMMLNLVQLGIARLPTVITLVAMQGGILGIVYLLMHEDTFSGAFGTASLRLLALAAAMTVIKGWVMPRMLYYAFKESHMRGPIEPFIGLTASLIVGAIGTGIMIAASSYLPLHKEHFSHLLVPAALSTVFTGFLMLTTRREPLTQVIGYLVLENGIFIFGLLLVHAMPFLVEVGILLDLFVCVFVMGIILHHVDRQFPIPTSDHLRTLKE